MGIIFYNLAAQKPAAPVSLNTGQDRGGQISLAPQGTSFPTGPAEPTRPPFTPTPLPSPTFTNIPLSPTPTGFPSPTETPEPDNTLVPFKIKIPAIGVDTFVERVGIAQDGTMDVPKNIWNTSWFGEGGYKPGQAGNAVIAGHLDAPGTKAVFWDLIKLKPGDIITLADENNKELNFQVYDNKVFPVENAPLVEIFGPANEAHLNLITCAGTFNPLSRIYNKRVVVFARLS